MDSAHDLFRAARKVEEAGDRDAAAKLYEEIVSLHPDYAPALFAHGITLNRRMEYRPAADILERALMSRSGDPAIHNELAESLRNLGEYREAVGCCLTALRLRPSFPEAYNTLGLSLRGAGDVEGALVQFRQSLACREAFHAGHANAARALGELGRLGEAIPHLRRAAELAPDPCPAWTDLGNALIGLDRATDALPALREAARLRPDLAITHHNLGNALRLMGQGVEARGSYLKAIRLDPGLALSHLHIGMTLRLEGALGDAVKWYKLAVEMEPDKVEIWADLADLYQKRDEPDEAISCRRRALELSLRDPIDALIDLGWALQEDGRPGEALEQYHIARGVRPASAQVHLALGGVHEEMGDFAAAEAALREAIRLRPRFPGAYGRLATLLRGKLPDGDLRVVESLLADPVLAPHPRARLLFALAHVLDARGEYPRAAACLREANASTIDSRRAEGLIYEPDDHDRLVERLIRAFDRDFFRRIGGLGLETRRPVFVIGLPRSGTTLVEQILASHPRVHGAGERLFGRRSFERLPSVVGADDAPAECVALLEGYSLRRLAGEHLAKLNALDLGRSDRVVDKLPDNYLYIGLLVALFPNAVFVHCRRDLRDVAVSCWMNDFRSIRWSNDPMHISRRFRQYRRLMEHWGREFPAPILEVNYEDTVADLEGVARRLLEACGLEWDAACLEFHRTERVVRTASLNQVRRPLYKSSVARWKNYEGDLLDLFEMLADADLES